MKRLAGLVAVALCLAWPGVAVSKEHGGQEHGGTTLTDTKPPGLSKQKNTPAGLEKHGKEPAGWKKGRKEGWKKNRKPAPATPQRTDAKP